MTVVELLEGLNINNSTSLNLFSLFNNLSPMLHLFGSQATWSIEL